MRPSRRASFVRPSSFVRFPDRRPALRAVRTPTQWPGIQSGTMILGLRTPTRSSVVPSR